jgi:hypothetical protein
MTERKTIAVAGATGARGGGLVLDACLAQNAAKIPVR